MLDLPKMVLAVAVIAAIVARAKSVHETNAVQNSAIEEHRQRMNTIIGHSFVD